MTKKHQPFFSKYGSLSVQLCNEPGVELAMCIEEANVIITKQEAMGFFGLMEKPEPKKPFYAELIQAYIMGEVIECRHELWEPSNHWELLVDVDEHVAAVFLGYEEDRRYSFRIKPE